MSEVNDLTKEYIHTNALKPILEIYCDKLENSISKGFIKCAENYIRLMESIVDFTNLVERPIKNQNWSVRKSYENL